MAYNQDKKYAQMKAKLQKDLKKVPSNLTNKKRHIQAQIKRLDDAFKGRTKKLLDGGKSSAVSRRERKPLVYQSGARKDKTDQVFKQASAKMTAERKKLSSSRTSPTTKKVPKLLPKLPGKLTKPLPVKKAAPKKVVNRNPSRNLMSDRRGTNIPQAEQRKLLDSGKVAAPKKTPKKKTDRITRRYLNNKTPKSPKPPKKAAPKKGAPKKVTHPLSGPSRAALIRGTAPKKAAPKKAPKKKAAKKRKQHPMGPEYTPPAGAPKAAKKYVRKELKKIRKKTPNLMPKKDKDGKLTARGRLEKLWINRGYKNKYK